MLAFPSAYSTRSASEAGELEALVVSTGVTPIASASARNSNGPKSLRTAHHDGCQWPRFHAGQHGSAAAARLHGGPVHRVQMAALLFGPDAKDPPNLMALTPIDCSVATPEARTGSPAKRPQAAGCSVTKSSETSASPDTPSWNSPAHRPSLPMPQPVLAASGGSETV